MRTWFTHATVLTMNDAGEIKSDAAVLVEDGRIASILEEAPSDRLLADDRIIDLDGDLLMPGLINAHTHISMSLFRNYGNDVALHTWLNDYIWPLEDQMTPEDILIGAELSILEMLRGGTTTFCDMYGEEDRIAELVERTGIRAVLASGTLDGNIERKRSEMRRLSFWNHRANDRIHIMVGPHAPYTCSPDTLRELKRWGEEYDVGFHIHLAETREEDQMIRQRYGVSPAMYLHQAGMLLPSTILAHSIWLDEEDQELIAAACCSCVYNPTSNMKLASGFMPLHALRERGINVALGTDGASSNNTQDMFRELLVGSLIQKGHQLDPTVADAHTMLWMATRGGAQAIGQEKDLGSVEVGKKADLIVVSQKNIRHTPKPQDIEAGLVYATASDDVRYTMVDGKLLMENGDFCGIQEEQVRHAAEMAWMRLYERGAQHVHRN